MESMQLFLKHTNVLIVDDSSFNIKILTRILKQKGYNNIRNVLNDELALKSARENPPDIILIEISVSNMYGFEICKSFKSDENFKEIPIIFIGTDNENIDKEKVFIVGGGRLFNYAI